MMWLMLLSMTFTQVVQGHGTLPVVLIHKLRLDAAAGTRFQARLSQATLGFKEGAKIQGVVEGTQNGCATLRFESVEGRSLRAGVRAMASYLAVETARVPLTKGDRGTSEASAEHNLIGGAQMYGDFGGVYAGATKVGHAEGGKVLGQLTADHGCRVSSVEENHALGWFSPEACGSYDLPVQIRSAEDDPKVVLCAQGKPELAAGTAMLLLTTQP